MFITYGMHFNSYGISKCGKTKQKIFMRSQAILGQFSEYQRDVSIIIMTEIIRLATQAVVVKIHYIETKIVLQKQSTSKS